MLFFLKYKLKFTNATHKIVRFSEKNRSFWSIYLKNYTCIAWTCLIIIFNHCKGTFSGFETKKHYLDAKKNFFLHSVQKIILWNDIFSDMDLVPCGPCVMLKQMNISIKIFIQIQKNFFYLWSSSLRQKRDFIVEFLTNFYFFTFVIRITFLTIIGTYIHRYTQLYIYQSGFIYILSSLLFLLLFLIIFFITFAFSLHICTQYFCNRFGNWL